ncbi:MAG TPA: DUF2852 domain-containing protein [Stellaceae bacterium]|nr:DUF2852 domain-containing protein [Stellaceae bacterium]
MELAARLDDIPKPLWIGLMVLGFALYWPVGLALLAYLLWSGRMGCWKHSRRFWRDEGASGRWHHDGRRGGSGNRAFDDYRQETLRRLEDEQRQFVAFLERLRLAKDKEEFDAFLAERRRANDGPPPPPPT